MLYLLAAGIILLFSSAFSVAAQQFDEVIVFLKDKKIPSVIKANSIVKQSDRRIVVRVPEGKDPEEFMKKLKSQPDVGLVIPNYIIKKQLIPNDTYYPNQWYLPLIGMENAWDITTGSSTVYVAVLDTGVDFDHPEIRPNIWLNPEEICDDGLDNDGNGYKDDCYGFNAVAGSGSAVDGDGHGTHVSGIIGAVGNNGQGVAGINWNVKIIPCKFLDDSGNGRLNDLLECLNYIKSLQTDKGIPITVINGSYGFYGDSTLLTVDCLENPNTEKCLIQSIGAVFVAAAGNMNENNDRTLFFPCDYSTVLDNVICVGATDRNDQKTAYSNYGSNSVSMFAPGGSLDGTGDCFEYMVQNLNILSNATNIDDTNNYACISGTSQATPMVSGAVALLKASESTLDTAGLIRRVLSTGDNFITLSGYSKTCNRVNVYNALVNESSAKLCFSQFIGEDLSGYYHNVGVIGIGVEKVFTLDIKSTGSVPLNISGVSLQTGTVYQIQSNGCSGSYNFGEECSIVLSVRSTTAGNVTDTLTINTNSSYGDLQIRLTALAENLPDINAFTAVPSSGAPPLNVRFTFNVSDADGDSMNCYLDADGDGTYDITVLGCDGSYERIYTYTAEGNYTAVLKVIDSQGGVSTATVNISVKAGDGGGGCSMSKSNDTGITAGLFILLALIAYRRFKVQF
ncbi:S8 family serine peptidase [Persephonella sp.]